MADDGVDAEAVGWRELTAFLPFHGSNVPLDVLTRTYLGVVYAMKGTVEHWAWGAWPLSVPMRRYATADVCVVIDVLHAAEGLRDQGPAS